MTVWGPQSSNLMDKVHVSGMLQFSLTSKTDLAVQLVLDRTIHMRPKLHERSHRAFHVVHVERKKGRVAGRESSFALYGGEVQRRAAGVQLTKRRRGFQDGELQPLGVKTGRFLHVSGEEENAPKSCHGCLPSMSRMNINQVLSSCK